jgi:hypothetical protein
MAPTGAAYHIDWIFSNNSNVHVANHRDWFTTFTDFPTELGHYAFAQQRLQVVGIGDVELQVKTHPTRGGKGTRKPLVLRDVLYAPTALTNILGNPLFREHTVTTHGVEGGMLKRKDNGANADLLDHCVLFKLRLSGQRKGQSSLDPNGVYSIGASRTNAEHARWLEFNGSHQQLQRPTQQQPGGATDSRPLSTNGFCSCQR